MNIHIGLVTYALDVTRLVLALSTPNVTWHVFQHSAYADVITQCQRLADFVPNFHYHDYRENRGLSRSWNDALIEAYVSGADCVILANDDLTMTRADLNILVKGCVDHPECGAVVCNGFNQRMDAYQDLGFSIIGINPIGVETVGMFDENLIPYTYEDSDWSRRSALLGMKWRNAGDTNIVHVGSATVATDAPLNRQHSQTMQATRAYYIRKWGGAPGQETFSVPFNDAHFDNRIEPHLRHAPYDGYNRTDLEMIKV